MKDAVTIRPRQVTTRSKTRCIKQLRASQTKTRVYPLKKVSSERLNYNILSVLTNELVRSSRRDDAEKEVVESRNFENVNS